MIIQEVLKVQFYRNKRTFNTCVIYIYYFLQIFLKLHWKYNFSLERTVFLWCQFIFNPLLIKIHFFKLKPMVKKSTYVKNLLMWKILLIFLIFTNIFVIVLNAYPWVFNNIKNSNSIKYFVLSFQISVENAKQPLED